MLIIHKRSRKMMVIMAQTSILLMMMVMLLNESSKKQKTEGDTEEKEKDDGTNAVEFLARLRGPLEYDDPELLSLIRRKYLIPPSHLPYALMIDRRDYEAGVYNSFIEMDPAYTTLQKMLLKVLKGVYNGFFVEAGAVDGEFLSNTLLLERRQSWTGLLVEADGDMFHHLLGRHRKAWASHSCLAPHAYAHREVLIKYSGSALSHPGTSMYARGHGVLVSHEKVSPLKVTGGDIGDAVPLYESVQCLPLASLLLALNISVVNLLSLDVEGAEPHILQSFPWGRITVDVWLVEHVVAHNVTQKKRDSQANSNISPHHSSQHSISKSHQSSADALHSLNIHKHQLYNQQRGDVEFVSFFLSKGYVLYPMNTKSLLDNYIFIRKNSSVLKRLNLDEMETI